MQTKPAIVVLFVAAAAGLGVYMSRGPWMAYKQQKLKTEAATQEMQKAEQSRNELVQQKAKVESPLGREALARDMGYHKKDEVPVEEH